MHAHEVYLYEMHAREMHAREMHAREVHTELLVLLFRKKRTSIYACSSLFATLPPGACPAKSFSCLCVAKPPRTSQIVAAIWPIQNRKKGLEFAVHPDVRQTPKKVQGCFYLS
jgi:hypothetical protein